MTARSSPLKKTAIILANLGTPAAPTSGAVRQYLREFLSDPRVVEIPRIAWLPLLYGLILPLRAKASAQKYRSIWQPHEPGSPLLYHTLAQAQDLQARLGDAATVYAAMRYGKPSLNSVLSIAKQAGHEQVLVLPLYPQYSATTTASIYDSVQDWSRQQRDLPSLRLSRAFYTLPSYTQALAAQVRAHWQQHGQAQLLLLSFHGLPERNCTLGDPYAQHCQHTAEQLAQALGLQADQWRISYQSRFGKAKWLGPATDATLAALPQAGITHVDVICPGFVADCLETLEEINLEGRDTFLQAGGQRFHYIPCLNASPEGLDVLEALVRQEAAGWLNA